MVTPVLHHVPPATTTPQPLPVLSVLLNVPPVQSEQITALPANKAQSPPQEHAPPNAPTTNTPSEESVSRAHPAAMDA